MQIVTLCVTRPLVDLRWPELTRTFSNILKCRFGLIPTIGVESLGPVGKNACRFPRKRTYPITLARQIGKHASP